MDYGENGEIVGIEIENFSKRKEIEVPVVGNFLPISVGGGEGC